MVYLVKKISALPKGNTLFPPIKKCVNWYVFHLLFTGYPNVRMSVLFANNFGFGCYDMNCLYCWQIYWNDASMMLYLDVVDDYRCYCVSYFHLTQSSLFYLHCLCYPSIMLFSEICFVNMCCVTKPTKILPMDYIIYIHPTVHV